MRCRNIQIALSIGLQLSFEEAESLMKSAGYAFSRSRKADVIVEYFFRNEIYDIDMINEVLYWYDQPLLGLIEEKLE